MLNIPEAIKALFKQDGVRKNFRAHFPNGELPDITNSDIVQESVKFSESLCSQDVFKFGLTEASVIEFETVGVSNMYGMWIECSCEIDTSSLSASELAAAGSEGFDGTLVLAEDSDIGYGFYRVPYGRFRVESCPRNHEAMAHRQVTGYSLNLSGLSKSLPDLPRTPVLSELIIDPSAFFYQLNENYLESADMRNKSGFLPNYRDNFSLLYTSNKTRFGVQGVAADGISYREGYQYTAPTSIRYPDFIKISLEYDRAAYNAAGMAVVKQVNDLGYDFRFNSSGKAIFSSNEEALRAQIPELFSPVIWMEGYEADDVTPSQSDFTGLLWHQEVIDQQLVPIVEYRSVADSRYNFAFTGTLDESAISEIRPKFVYFTSETKNIAFAKISDSSSTQVFTCPVSYPEITIKYAKAYKCKELSPFRIRLKPSNTLYSFTIPSGSTSKKATLNRFLYPGNYAREAFVDDWLELNAQFGKTERNGLPTAVRLSKATPIARTPEDYVQGWWDEFNVDAIGTIIFSYTDSAGSSQTVEYSIGSGSSVYDMTDNTVLDSLIDASVESIKTILDNCFIPYLEPVNYTPFDFSFKGMPHLEAGDYLQVVAEDGDIVNSYAMRQEISGVQVLSAGISSASGKIIDSEDLV